MIVAGPDVQRTLPGIRGGWRTIVADPPWRFDDEGSRITPEYRLLDNREIERMPIEALCADQAHLYLWCPSALLNVGLQVVRAWGFRFVATWIWCKVSENGKPRIGGGHYVRNAHEIVLIGVRGDLTASVRNVPSWIPAPRTDHSKKPEVFQDMIERMSPAPRLELFARRVRPGWLCFGNEITEAEAWTAFRRGEQQ